MSLLKARKSAPEHIPANPSPLGLNGRQSVSAAGTDLKTSPIDRLESILGPTRFDWVGRTQGRSGKGAVDEVTPANDSHVFFELKESVKEFDGFLEQLELHFTNFKDDLSSISSDLEALQAQSARIKINLKNRKAMEEILGPHAERAVLSPDLIRHIALGAVNERFVASLQELESKIVMVEESTDAARAMSDTGPMLQRLLDKALERIRDFLVERVRSMRSPNTNIQMIQRAVLLRYRYVFKFLNLHHPQLALEIEQAYILTMSWYYTSHVLRYRKSLERVPLRKWDRQTLIGADDSSKRNPVLSTRQSVPRIEAFTLGNREAVLQTKVAVPAYLAEQVKDPWWLEQIFSCLNICIVDNAGAEYGFLVEFLSFRSHDHVVAVFEEIFSGCFGMVQQYTETLIANNYDCIGILLCVRLLHQSEFELQRRKIPVLESYINRMKMLVWPRFQSIIDGHGESLRRNWTYSRGDEISRQSVAPFYLSQRFGDLLHCLFTLSPDSIDEPIANSLLRLRSDFEAALTKFSSTKANPQIREQFLLNNLILVLTIIEVYCIVKTC